MPRPKKGRYVQCLPAISAFRPVDAMAGEGEEVVLTVEEFEAIRLRDMEGLEQEACALEMQVSRQTLQRILNSARFKLASMLTRGLTLRIEGGEYRLNPGHYLCPNCHREFDIEAGNDRITHCPHCRGQVRHCGTDERACGRQRGQGCRASDRQDGE